MRWLIGTADVLRQGSWWDRREVLLNIRPVAIRLGAGAALTILAGCAGPDSQTENPAAVPRQDVLHYSNIDEPKRLDPAFVKDLYEGIVSGWLYDGLVGFGSGAEVEPRLAESWAVSADGRVYTFRLRPARFSNGQAVESSDVRYSFERILHPATGSDRRWVLDRIEGAEEFTSGTAYRVRGIETPDSATVSLRLNRASPVFLTMLAMPNASIIPEGSAGPLGGKPTADFDAAPVGTGPWVLRRRQRDRSLEFVSNTRHWGRHPTMKMLMYHVQADDTVRRRLFEIGSLDLYQVGYQAWDSWKVRPPRESRIESVQELRTDFFGINTSKPQLSDVRVRQALVRAIDREKIFRRLQKERGVLAHGPIPPGVAGYRADRQAHAYDLPEAMRLLALAGVTTGQLHLNIWYRDEALNSEVVESAAADLRRAGIVVVPVARDQAALRAGIWAGQPDLFLGSWTLDYPDPESALAPTFHSRNIPRQGNQTFFSDPITDRLIDAARSEVRQQERIRMWQMVEDRVQEMTPWIPLFHRKNYYAVQNNVGEWHPALMYNADRFTTITKTLAVDDLKRKRGNNY